MLIKFQFFKDSVKNPIQVAEKVMTETDHCMLVGQGATCFALSQGFQLVPADELVVPWAIKGLERFKAGDDITNEINDDYPEEVVKPMEPNL